MAKEHKLDKHKELLIENKNESYGRLCDLLSFEGTMVTENTIKNWFKRNDIERSTTSSKPRLNKNGEIVVSKSKNKKCKYGLAYGNAQKHRMSTASTRG